MRNLKKLLAVIVSVCVLATFALPAFAAEQTPAEICEDLGVLKGDSLEGVTDTYLAKGTSRMQAAILFLRLIGKEDTAYAFEGEENFTDADQTWDKAKIALAYLKANPDLGWAGRTDGTFDPTAAISAQELYKVLLESLGYKQDAEDGFKWADVFTFAADKGLSLIADVTDVTNDDMAIAIVETLKLTLKDSETTLIEDLVAKGVVTEAAAIAAGLIAATPDALEVASATATNLIQAVVTFNQKVDKDTATDEDNYDFATADNITVADAALSEDGVSVVLTFAAKVDQQKAAKLTVSGVKTAAGAVMTKSTTEVSFLDSTIPEIVSAEVAGISTIKVTFSEPMDDTSVTAASFKVNDGKYYVKGVSAQKNNTEFLVELYTSLKDGDLPFEVKVGPKDYAGFTAMGFSATLTVVEDKEAPVVVSFKDAKPNSVVLIWSEDIVLVSNPSAKANYYHTNSSNQIDANLTSAEIDGNEMTLKFADANKLPNGTAYAYVLKEAVKDLWNNKNAQQMTKLDVVVDNTAPVLQSIDFKDEQKIELAFDEDVKASTANKKANYTLLDKDGKEVKNIFSSITTDGKKVTVNFTKKLSGGDYTLVVKDVEDIAGNAMSSTSMGFTVTDKTKPVAGDFSAKLYTVVGASGNDQILKVSFGEAMAIGGTYGIDDLAKYMFTDDSKALNDIDDVTLAVVDDGKAVEITIPVAKYTVPTGAGKLTIARVADAAGNYTAALTNAVTITGSGNVSVDKAELTGEKEIKVYFTDALSKFEAKEIIFSAGGEFSSVTTELKDGKTVATYTVTDALPNNASALTVTTKTPAAPATENVTANSYGETLAIAIAPKAVADKVAPVLAKSGDDDDVAVSVTGRTGTPGDYKYTSVISLTFKEALNPAYLHYGSFEVSGFDVSGIALNSGDAKVVEITVVGEIPVEENVAITLKSGIRDVVSGEAGNELAELDTSVMRSLDAPAVKAKADAVVLTLAVETGATTLATIPAPATGYTIAVKSTSSAAVYDATGKGVAAGTANVVYTVTHTASGRAADTGIVVVTVAAP